jgi:hypothetical protein
MSPCSRASALFSGCGYGSIETTMAERFFNEALDQTVVFDDENDR